MKKLLSLISCILFLFSTSSSVFSATELVPSSVGELVYAGNWNGHGYAVIHNAPASWLEAKAYCESMGGYLAVVTSAEENAFIASKLTQGHYSLGGVNVRNSTSWDWLTGEANVYSNWSKGEPNGGGSAKYILMYGPTSAFIPGTWDDFWGNNYNTSGYVCEWNYKISTDTPDDDNTDTPDDDGDDTLPDDVFVDENGITKYKWNGHTYAVIEGSEIYWNDAKVACENMGGHLATITSERENNFISSLLVSDYYYLGGQNVYTSTDWCWITGESNSYSNWNKGEPNSYGNQPYMAIYGPTSGSQFPLGTWDDGWDGDGSGYVCEWDDIATEELTDVTSYYYSDSKSFLFDCSLDNYSGLAKIYVALYDEKDKLTSVASGDIFGSATTSLTLPKTGNENAAYAKIYVWRGMDAVSKLHRIEL